MSVGRRPIDTLEGGGRLIALEVNLKNSAIMYKGQHRRCDAMSVGYATKLLSDVLTPLI